MKDTARTLDIMMVEDNEDLCSGWEDLFALLGHRLRCYHRSMEALAALPAADSCDLVISDYYLPDLNGVELIKQIRHRRPGIPAILLTGSKEDTVMTAVREIPGCRVLHKPVNIEDLDREVRSLCDVADAAGSA